MPTGPLHARVSSNGSVYEKCRCMIGHEHDENGWYEDDNDGDGAAKYCCGAIYEEGEDTCKSCGEPL